MSDCIDEYRLNRYIRRRLSREDMDAVEKHLLECDECLDDLVLAKAMMRDLDSVEWEPASESAVHRIFETIRRGLKQVMKWIPDLTPPMWLLAPAASPVRSHAHESPQTHRDAVLLEKEFNSFFAEMYIEKIRPDTVTLSVRITVNHDRPKNVTISLISDSGKLASRFLHNDFEVFDDLMFGNYQLILKQNAEVKYEYYFAVDHEGFREK